MNSIGVRLECFGALRDHSDGKDILVQIKKGATLKELRQILASQIGNLVFESALADQSQILSDEFVLDKDIKLFILPPVCGG